MRRLAREYSLEARPRMESMAAAAARLSLLQAAAASAHDGGRDVAYTAALALSEDASRPLELKVGAGRSELLLEMPTTAVR